MLQTVDVGTQSLEAYEAAAGPEVIEQLRSLAKPLRNLRVLHLNATPYGGGVAEILRSEIPLLRDLGLDAHWKIITGDQTFFTVTKIIHNGLQGDARALGLEEQETYLNNSRRNADFLHDEYDVIFIHDPQPLALRHLRGPGSARWIWRCHIDTAKPNPQIWSFLRPFLAGFDAAVFTLGEFVPKDIPLQRIEIMPPAIDPESPKNMELSPATVRRVLHWIGIKLDRPLITQISRFDPWKDPLGVIAAYERVRKEIPQCQLALVGSMALDDPEGWDIYRRVQAAASADPQIHIFTNLTGVGNIEVNSFQRFSNVVVQKSIREGFGLVVSEALWKGTPVVAGRAGGIPLQMQNGAGGFLVDSIEDCADRILWLLRHPSQGKELAARGKALVRERFLLPRLLAEELRLMSDLVGLTPPAEDAAKAGLTGELRDPVCGMRLQPGKDRLFEADYQNQRHYFCSAVCRDAFLQAPRHYARFDEANLIAKD